MDYVGAVLILIGISLITWNHLKTKKDRVERREQGVEMVAHMGEQRKLLKRLKSRIKGKGLHHKPSILDSVAHIETKIKDIDKFKEKLQ